MGFDVFNALDLMDNREFLEKLKFGVGDGFLQYYLYNWKCPHMETNQVSIIFFLLFLIFFLLFLHLLSSSSSCSSSILFSLFVLSSIFLIILFLVWSRNQKYLQDFSKLVQTASSRRYTMKKSNMKLFIMHHGHGSCIHKYLCIAQIYF